MEEITLNLIPGGATQVVHASQFDKGRQFKLLTYDGDMPFDPSTYTAEFEAIKPDGNIVQANVTKSSTGVTVTTTEQMCAVEGDTICEIRFSKNNRVIGSANFILRVEMDPIFEGTSSQSEGQIYDDIQNLKAYKQNKLIAGDNIQLQDNGGEHPTTTISATDTTYTAGSHIAISGVDNEISAIYTAGTGITITGDEIADVPYTAGAGISISTARVISADIATLPIASTATLGCIKVGANLAIDPDGTLSSTGGGGGGGDYLAGDNIQISAARVISATDTTYTAGNGIDISGVSNEISVDISDLSDASTASAGLMSATDKVKLDGIEPGANNYTLPTASTATLGGIKVGSNMSIDNGYLTVPLASTASDGLMSAANYNKLDGIEAHANNYTLPMASTATLGGIKVGFNLAIDANGVLSASPSTIQTVTVPASSWDPDTNTARVSVTGVTTETHQDILPLLGNDTNLPNNLALLNAVIFDAGQGNGYIDIYAINIPTSAISFRVVIHM